MPYKEKKVEKLYYSIGEVAEMFNVNAFTDPLLGKGI